MPASRLVILVGTAALLAACNPAKHAPSAPAAGSSAAPAQDRQLWTIQTLDQNDLVTRTVLICADQRIRESFARPMPSPNDQPCNLIGPAIVTPEVPGVTPGRFSARCRSPDGRFMNVQASTFGDRERDFTMRLLIQAAVGGRQDLVQALRFRQAGPCPPDWTIGDAAAPGDTQLVNSLSGARRPLSAPVAATAP